MSYIWWVDLLNVEISYYVRVVYYLLQCDSLSNINAAFKEPMLGEGATKMENT